MLRRIAEEGAVSDSRLSSPSSWFLTIVEPRLPVMDRMAPELIRHNDFGTTP